MRLVKIIVAAVIVIALAVTAGTYAYIHFVKDEAPAAFTSDSTTETTASGSTNTTAASGTLPADLSGTWAPTSASQVGYRVKEILFGQSTEGVGRSNAVTGSLALDGTSVTTATFTADMTKLKSDSDRRDSQVQGRILETSQYPTATFALSAPITLPAAPSTAGATVTAKGNLTLHGVTKAVTVDLAFKTSGSNVVVTGAIPVAFADYDIDDPSFGGAEVENNGTLELSLTFAKQ